MEDMHVADRGIELDDFARAVSEGLSREQKDLPCRFLYDARGSDLFEDITLLEEYYPTRTEAAILKQCSQDIAERTPAGAMLVEFGSGSSTKTEILLQALDKLGVYVAIDVSQSALDEARARILARFPGLRIETLVADFAEPMELPGAKEASAVLGFFPGSTIGNLTREEAVKLLHHFGRILGTGARFVVGVDLKKDLSRLLPAYDDARGVTAAFNKNILARINRELGADFDVDAFDHEARWNNEKGRVEMHLVSNRDQTVEVRGQRYSFAKGETIHTENSHKYTIDQFQTLARNAGWEPVAVWTDANRLFSVHELVFSGA
ncbi:MAG: L-histidine N(alpha)-methyltransferase [Hyphomicrobiales bacterium]|nr:L-histidine N(alpha)-methyltransferase [Hyphomicrobiales bacterium]